LIEGALDDLIGGSLRARPLVILYTDGSYGRTLAESVRDQVADAGLVVAMYEAFEPDEGVLEAASRARAEDPGLVLVLAGQADSALMVSALRDALGETPILAGDSVLTPEFPLLADAGAEGVVFARPTVWRQHIAADDLAALEGDSPGALLGLVAPSMAATQIAFAQVLGQSEAPYDTVLGPLIFDEKGDLERPSFELWQWRAGTVWPLDRDPIEADPS
jgi:branched-chain amino acid transport system substrate-binding protein